MLSTEMEAKAIEKAGTKAAGKKFIKAVRARFNPHDVLDLPKFGTVKTACGLYCWSEQTGIFYNLSILPI